MSEQGKRTTAGTRKGQQPKERRQAILKAALEAFSQKGFANARIEDIARRAGVGKGTVYLYFPDKQSLFKSLISANLEPLIGQANRFLEEADLPPRETLKAFYRLLTEEILMTERSDLVRLMITEMAMFPEIAAYYHDNLIKPGLALITRLLKQAETRGELRSHHALAAPQVVFAPAVLSVVWNMLFARYSDLDRRAAFDFFLDTLFTQEDKGDVR